MTISKLIAIMYSRQLTFDLAQARVVELKKFYKDVVQFAGFAVLFGTFDYLTNELSYAWCLWIIVPMALGLCIRALQTFYLAGALRRWKRRKIAKLLETTH